MPMKAPAPSAPSSEIFAPGLMKDKVLFVSGGGSGIGLGICMAFARLGAKVAICGRTESKLEDAAKAIKRAGAADVFYGTADVRNYDALKAVIDAAGEKYGKIDVCVNNAAGNFMSLVEDISPPAFQTVIDIDLRGTFHCSKAVRPWLVKAAEGGAGATLISISATLHYTGIPFQGHAAAAKAGIDSLTKTMAAEWAEDNIRVVGIAPGPVADTEGGPTGRVFGAQLNNDPEATARATRLICPIGRYGKTDDIANAAVFLASPGGSWITGTNIIVDGFSWQAGMSNGMMQNKEAIRQAMRQQKEGRVKGSGSKGHADDRQSKL